jgi:glycosyltransferase involved in cell wall biosynthesis
MPDTVNGEPYTTLVVVDGGDDRTAEIARSFPGVKVIEFPVNLGHGVALQVTYRYCIDHDVKYVVTLDADGQNDPSEIPQILQPLIDDTSDFVVASRVLGEDKTSDVVRKSGVRFFSFVMNRMTGANLTDTSTGYRALRVTMLADVVDRLTQEQYQTAELLITCLKRGWRASEVPTVWYPRASGTTKKGKNWLFGFRYARVVFGTWWRER